MNKVVTIASALALSLGVSAANAASVEYIIEGGNWTNTQTWNNNANGTIGTFVYDNGANPGCPLFGGVPTCFPPFSEWRTPAGVGIAEADIPDATGTYSGTIIADDVTREVTGGSLIITGLIADQVVVGPNSWWLRTWTNVTINLETGLSTVGAVGCFQSGTAPAGCNMGVIQGQPGAFNLAAGFETVGGCLFTLPDPPGEAVLCQAPFDGLARFAAEFDAASGILSLFKEGRNQATSPTGTDLAYNFEISVVPVPAAVWLFGSALGLMAALRRRRMIA